MTYTRCDYESVEPVGGGLHFLREALDCTQLGFSVRDCPPGTVGLEHDHADDGQEEVYFLVEGEATIVVDGEPVELTAGDALRVSADATRQLHVDEVTSRFVIAGAP